MSDRKACGPHAVLGSNPSVRITQCPCGTVHVTFVSNGVTLRINEDSLRGITHGLMAALDKVEEREGVRVN
ncbi:MAG: hypothetical protein JNL21_40010 [Myxococcales bacterium]|nr:hypothetical protein [Myxococcales bacterium]